MTTMTAAQVRAHTDGMDPAPDAEVPKRPPTAVSGCLQVAGLGGVRAAGQGWQGAPCCAVRGCTPRCCRSGASTATRRLMRKNARLVVMNARLRDQLARQAKVLEVQGSSPLRLHGGPGRCLGRASRALRPQAPLSPRLPEAVGDQQAGRPNQGVSAISPADLSHRG
jgi:hypothetical protein